MPRILVVANRTLGGAPLLELLRQRAERERCEVHVLVPAAPETGSWASGVDDDLRAARRRLDTALGRFSTLGCEVTGEIGDSRPLDAVTDALRLGTFDEVVVSTLPPGISRWLRADLVSRLVRFVDVPVTHVVSHERMPAKSES